MPVNINAGKVKKVPPPANAFCMPAHNEMTNKPVRRSRGGGSFGRGLMLRAYGQAIQ